MHPMHQASQMTDAQLLAAKLAAQGAAVVPGAGWAYPGTTAGSPTPSEITYGISDTSNMDDEGVGESGIYLDGEKVGSSINVTLGKAALDESETFGGI